MKTELKSLALFIALVAPLGSAQAQDKGSIGDYYIRAEYSNGEFIGSHQILASAKGDYKEVTYCGKQFWVRPSTVFWTEKEAEAGNELYLMQNTKDEQVIVCANPEEHVTLATIGISKDNFLPRPGGGGAFQAPRRSRLNVIAEAFKDFKNK